ncbi:hypothetical protein CDD80_5492 [Ophiocordyceps camponoti-rufipedis]|uniref:Protein arginine N-methyltransferase domain-containing protein n=1 Tax=Ophiocordyceps camponoti-rufipedis TaxID=2004952 RepID=A0A2C5YU33_9HYPO|nr:hypothetical protein CDD80_5492 [Ophiocordyceps camponoti-rufipedis]
MLCAKAGASRVLAVDKSDIIDKARENVFNNGLSKAITCLRGSIEDVVLPVDKVDIIVSEWMGYCLLYEAMLPSVLYARDKYLKPEGLLVPSSATLWIAPVEDQAYVDESVSYWQDVYGFDMRAMQEGIFNEVRVEAMTKASLCGNGFPFKVLDLRSAKNEDLEFAARWSSTLNRKVDRIDGFLIWFDIFFSPSPGAPLPELYVTPTEWCAKPGNYGFTTGPHGKETHWKQGLVLIAQPGSPLELSAQHTVSGTISFSVPEHSRRALKLENAWSISGQEMNQSWDLR